MGNREFEVTTDGVLSLSIRNDTNRPWWWYLDVHGQPLYLLGNTCGTCSAIFRMVRNADLPLTPRQLSTQLEAGFNAIPQDVIDTVAVLLPKGKYRVELSTITPSLMTRQSRPPEVSCEADYFWLCHLEKSKQGDDYEIVLPMVMHSDLNPSRIAYYEAEFASGHNPTALALSIYDCRVPMGRYYQNALAHFLLDGHHKVLAASQMSRPISILSFLRLNSYGES